jgi:hypothetical protein
MRSSSRACITILLGVGLLTGCAGAQDPEVDRVATTFEDPSADPSERCGLLAPKTLEQLEEESGPCEDAVENLPLEGGEVRTVEVWGGDAQVRLGADTLFLTRTPAGWKVAAAVCTRRPEGPYDCEVEG